METGFNDVDPCKENVHADRRPLERPIEAAQAPADAAEL